MLGADDSHGAVGRDLGGELDGGVCCQQLLEYRSASTSWLAASLTDHTLAAARDDLADEANLLGLLGVELAARERQLACLGPVPDDLGEALQGANVGSQADLDLLTVSSAISATHQDAHGRVVGAETDVASRRKVDGEANGDAVDSADDRLAALLERRDGGLETLLVSRVLLAGSGLTEMCWCVSKAWRAASSAWLLPMWVALTAVSWAGDGSSRSRPAVKIFSMAEAKTMTRTSASSETRSMVAWSSSQNLCVRDDAE